jgi:hypothetical protein
MTGERMLMEAFLNLLCRISFKEHLKIIRISLDVIPQSHQLPDCQVQVCPRMMPTLFNIVNTDSWLEKSYTL